MKRKVELLFISLALISLLAGLFWGVVASIQFVMPNFFSLVPFYKTRPLHVSLVVAWIFLSSIGGIYYYIPTFTKRPIFSNKIALIHFYMFLVTGLIILVCYFIGKFGGREYWEFPPILAIPIVISWILFGLNYFKSLINIWIDQPVYVWMWTTGIIFFILTFSESYLWLLPVTKDNVVREITFQWKSYGALVGSWNMLVYGTAIYLMEKIKGDGQISKSRLSYYSFFLGFINLLFGWAHHIYNVPTPLWIRYTSYVISMTELLFIAKIIWFWKNSLTDYQKNSHVLPYKFLMASDIWIFLNLILAIMISIPAVNFYTHGTHITVAHAMGSTVGINSTILLASCLFIIEKSTEIKLSSDKLKVIKVGYILFNLSLLIFWLSLIFAGYLKGVGMIDNRLTFSEIMQKINPLMIVFSISGVGIFASVIMIVYHPLKILLEYLFCKDK